MPKNIVCFHGFAQNSDTMKKRLSKLFRVKKNYNLVYMDGAVKLPGENSFAYWVHSREDPLNIDWNDHSKDGTILYGIDDSLKKFIELGNSLGQIDGIIGFSQGGCFADYICKLHANGHVPLLSEGEKVDLLPFNINFAIFISSRNFDRCGYNLAKPTIRSLHIYGDGDTIIPPNLSKDLSETYPANEKQIIIHRGAHIIPSTSETKAAIKKFLDKKIDN